MKTVIKLIAVSALWCSAFVQAETVSTMVTTTGERIEVEQQARLHLVFMDIFASYSGLGAELQVAQLPTNFVRAYEQVWVQPHFNVTPAQVAEYQQLFPQVKPIVLDDGLQWMQRFSVWASPYHVLMRDGEVEFAGDYTELRHYLQLEPQPDPTVADSSPVALDADTMDYHHLKPGDAVPMGTVTTMNGERIKLATWYKNNQGARIVFLDALCPMPHFPGCEQQLQQLSLQLKQAPGKWLGVMSGFYVDEALVQGFLQRFDLSLPVVFSPKNELFAQFGVLATPYVIDVGPEGTLRQRQALSQALTPSASTAMTR
jgi:hypothetical protein